MSNKTGAIRHTHKYHKLKDGLWHCAFPKCTHFMPHNVAHNIIGKSSVCWSCGNEFILDELNMQSDRPECIECNGEVNELAEFLKSRGV